MSTLFDAALLPAPDELGYFSHPDLDRMVADDNEELFDLGKFAAAGYETSYTQFEYDAPDELRDRYFDHGDEEEQGVIGWTPTSPKGSGWQIVGIWDADDGPLAYFVRPTTQGGAS